jgi:hypothetical protein
LDRFLAPRPSQLAHKTPPPLRRTRSPRNPSLKSPPGYPSQERRAATSAREHRRIPVNLDPLPISFLHLHLYLIVTQLPDTILLSIVHQNNDNSRDRISPSARRSSDERLPKAPRPVRSRH